SRISALFVFGLGVIFVDDVERPAFNFTIANTLFYVAAVYQWLFCKSLTQVVSDRFDALAKASILIFFAIFELLRHYGNFEIRTVYMVCLALFLFGSQIHQLRQIRKIDSSPQLTYLQYATMIELSFAICRLIVLGLSTLSVQRVEQLPQALIFFTIAQLVANTVAYIAIGSYWTEKMALSSATFSNENEVIKKLLLERDELIASLLKANKTVAT
ncbi:MAG: sensor histidine kinase, partial [Polynucleobacter victoriensis]